MSNGPSQAPAPEPGVTQDVSSDDRLWAALSWLPVSPIWPLLSAVALLMEDTKKRPFIRYNAAVSLVTGLILIPITFLTLGLGALLYFVFFYWAYQAWQGQEVEVPYVSGLVRRRGWA